MSYILEALNKSQKERDLGRVPTLADTPPAHTRGAWWSNTAVIGALMLAFLAVLIALYAVFAEQLHGFIAATPARQSVPTSAVAVEIEPVTPPPANAAGPAPAPTAINDQGYSHEDSPPKTEPALSRVNDKPGAVPVISLPKVEFPEPPEPAPVKPTVSTAIPTQRRFPGESEEYNPEPTQAPSPAMPGPSLNWEEKQHTAISDPMEDPSPVVTKTATKHPPPQIVENPSSLPSVPVQKMARRPGSDQDLPYEIYRRLPDRKVSAMAYSEIPERRFVIVNSEKLLEKERTEQGLLVEEILEDGVIFNFEGNRFFRRLLP
ncbi:MAG: general secretion pathway protein GspB [Gammaproteobacteria bacterium]|nr:general secretion pathway protein GspB [Gammaproteobacteria bacterium]